MPDRADRAGGTPLAARGLPALVALATVSGLAAGVYVYLEQATRPDVLKVGRHTLTEVARAATGHQRAERVAFANGGKLLVVSCPRYHHVVFYRITEGERLETHRDLELAGKPVAVWPTRDRLFVLSRPPGDQRHVEPGWWEAFDFDGHPIGDRVRVGFYPDDMAVSPDGRHAYVLTSGRAEGEANRAAPALDVFEIPEGREVPRSVGQLTFNVAGDDPERLALSVSGKAAAVTLLGSNMVAAIDLFNPREPKLVGRSELPKLELPYPSRFEEDRIVMPVASGSEGVLIPLAGVGECVAATLPRGSGLELHYPSRRRSLGTLTLRGGTVGLSKIRPLGLAYCADRGLLAVTNRSGSVHLVAIRPETQTVAARAGR
jgi:glycerol-3-phosphate acyltransferase PlsY